MHVRFRRERAASETRSRRFLLTLGSLGLLVAAALAWVGINAPNSIPGRSYYTLGATFREADNVTSHYQVRVGGELVGQVLHPEVRDGLAHVELQLDSDIGPLRSDTELRVRPRSPIGVRFIELIPGKQGRPLGDGETIPATQTSASVPLDAVLGTLDARTRARTQDLLAALGEGLAGRGEELSAALGDAAGAVSSAGAVAGAVAERPGAARSLVRGAAAAAGAAEPVREDIARGLAPSARALDPLADAQDAVAETLRIGRASLSGAQAGLEATSPLLRETASLARELTPLLDEAPASLRETAALLEDGRPAVVRLDRTLAVARDAVSPTLGLLDAVDPALAPLDAVLRDARPLVTELGPRRCDVVFMLRNFESMLAWGTETGNFLRLKLIASPESIAGQQPSGTLAPAPRGNPSPAPCAVREDAATVGRGGAR